MILPRYLKTITILISFCGNSFQRTSSAIENFVNIPYLSIFGIQTGIQLEFRFFIQTCASDLAKFYCNGPGNIFGLRLICPMEYSIIHPCLQQIIRYRIRNGVTGCIGDLRNKIFAIFINLAIRIQRQKNTLENIACRCFNYVIKFHWIICVIR